MRARARTHARTHVTWSLLLCMSMCVFEHVIACAVEGRGPRSSLPTPLATSRAPHGVPSQLWQVHTVAGVMSDPAVLPAGVGAAVQLASAAQHAHAANRAYQVGAALLTRVPDLT